VMNFCDSCEELSGSVKASRFQLSNSISEEICVVAFIYLFMYMNLLVVWYTFLIYLAFGLLHNVD
jgi:hypothetical protein